MKKLFVLLFLQIIVFVRLSACADFGYDTPYYTLFIQDIVDDPRYIPFLRDLNNAYYSYMDTDKNKGNNQNNENIEEWQKYLGTSYDDALYLVFKASESDVNLLIKGENVSDSNLAFVTPEFVKKHKQALLYIRYAKSIEPYMTIIRSVDPNWYYYDDNTLTADQLDYDKEKRVMERSWKAETDKELKLRYGYQLVRLAHYTGRYEDAVSFFDTYVEPLNYKPAMYYHALAQKAGAERGLGDIFESNSNFFKVFSNSANLKQMALTSMRFNENVDYESFVNQAKTVNEKNDAYLLLGYLDFSNTLSEVKKITATSPDAVQAKVLMARILNSIEQDFIPSYYSYYGYYRGDTDVTPLGGDKRYPLAPKPELVAYANQVLTFAVNMSNNPATKDKDFWNITASFIYFLNKDYTTAKKTLEKVNSTNQMYALQKKNLEMYIDVSEHPLITAELEEKFYKEYGRVFDQASSNNDNIYTNSGFVVDVLANRYYLQKDYAKAFLLHNSLYDITFYPDLNLLDEIEAFYNKSNKNGLERFIAKRINERYFYYSGTNDSIKDIPSYINYIRGIVYLSNNDLESALTYFDKVKDDKIFLGVPNTIFGYNLYESFESPDDAIMISDYISDFPVIKNGMTERELVKALIELEKIAKKNDQRSAKANFLLGNFFYNVTTTGYYRHVLRFDQTNGNGAKYYLGESNKPDIYNGIYFKSYPMYFENNVSRPESYLKTAYKLAKDDELKAKIVFALSKCEQEMHYIANSANYYGYFYKPEDILISDRVYFKELEKYKNTKFFDEARTYCKYFDYYVNVNM